MSRIVLVPGAPALLPAYASRDDPVADVRRACLAAVSWLMAPGGSVGVAAGAGGARVAAYLLETVAPGTAVHAPGPVAAAEGLLVVGNGSARRTDRSPGAFDERARGFDTALGAALARPDPDTLRELDRVLGEELLADLDGIATLPDRLTSGHAAEVDYDDDPYGVQYWVVRWSCDS